MELTREQLYDAIWKTPAIQLAKSYGISDVALAKICKKANIPKPSLGHWRLVELGRTPGKLLLPAAPAGYPSTIRITGNIIDKQIQVLSPEVESVIAPFRNPENKIQIAEDFRKAHSLVRQARDFLRGGHTDTEGRIRANLNERYLAVNVTKSCRDRALLIMDAILQTAERLGYQIEVGNERSDATAVKIGGEAVKILITEKVERVERELTEKEKGERYIWDRWRYNSTGRLIFRIDEYEPKGGRKSWSDGKKQQLEDQLNEIIEAIAVTADALRIRRLEWAERERQWAEQARLREERARKEREELARRALLLEKVEFWVKSKNLEAFLDEASKEMQKVGTVSDNSPEAVWLTWARGFSKQLNPFCTDYLNKAIEELRNK